MNQELENKLNEWRKKDELVLRNFECLETTLIEGENLIRLSISLNINFDNEQKKIEVSKLFQTIAQSNEKLNSQGDIYTLEKISNCLENDFWEMYNKTIEELLANK